MRSTTDLAIALYSLAQRCDGVETIEMTVSREKWSDSRYIRINHDSVIRISGHNAPSDKYALNLVCKNEHRLASAWDVASRWIRKNYGPELTA